MNCGIKRVFKQITGVLFFLLIILCRTGVVEAENESFEQLHSISAVLMDAETGRVLEGKNIDEKRPMASTTKIMTCILALEEGNMEDVVEVSKNAQVQPAVHLEMKEGQKFYLKDLLYSLMLESHNDSAVAIAEHIGGTVEDFTKMMNQKAMELGCQNTHFVTPNGLDGEDEGGSHGTTAEDLAKIMSYCILKSEKSKQFLKITQEQDWSFQDCSGGNTYYCKNHNAFLKMMKGALSGKTGFTGEAGYCYVGALENNDRYFTVALLASGWPSHKNYKWEDTKCLMNYGMEHYHNQSVILPQKLEPILVDNGFVKQVAVQIDTTERDFEILLKDDEKLYEKIHYKKRLQAPIKEGEVIGKIDYYINDKRMKEYDIVTTASIEKRTFLKIIKRNVLLFFNMIK